MPQTKENAPRSCSGAGTLRDHGAEREHAVTTGQATRTAGTEPGLPPQDLHRIALRDRALRARWKRGGAREATCLIISHATVSRTAAMLCDHARDLDHYGRSHLPLRTGSSPERCCSCPPLTASWPSLLLSATGFNSNVALPDVVLTATGRVTLLSKRTVNSNREGHDAHAPPGGALPGHSARPPPPGKPAPPASTASYSPRSMNSDLANKVLNAGIDIPDRVSFRAPMRVLVVGVQAARGGRLP